MSTLRERVEALADQAEEWERVGCVVRASDVRALLDAKETD